jgi:hypothetical protein
MNSEILWLLLGGSISGVAVAGIAKLLLPGKQAITGIEMLVIGTAAGFIGGLIAGLFGLEDETGFMRFIPLAISVGLAALAIVLWLNFRNRQVKNLLVPDAVEDSIAKTKTAVDQTTQKMASAAGSAATGVPKTGLEPTEKADLSKTA